MKLLPLALAVLAAAAATTSVVTADFGVAEGFSGIRNLDCTACHAPDPTGTVPPATAIVDGLPDGYDVDAAYPLTVTMEGGPPAIVAPNVPQGGFDIETTGGTFSFDPADGHLFDQPKPTEVLYSAEGAFQRSWDITWHAPALDGPPRTVYVFLAVVAANGNHIVGLDTSGGELGDASDAIVVEVPPSAATLAAWQEVPLDAPALDGLPTQLADFPARVSFTDPYDMDAWRILVDGAESDLRDDGVRAWSFQLDAPAAENTTLVLEAEAAGRTVQWTYPLSFPELRTAPRDAEATEADPDAMRDTPAPAAALLAPLLAAAWLARRR